MGKIPTSDVEWAREYEHRYLYSCYLYYHGPADVQAPLDDVAFDNLQTVLERHWYDNTSPAFRARISRGSMKTEAHALQFSDDEKRAALDWAARRVEDTTAMALINT